MDACATLGVPIDSVGRAGGTELAPGALRELGVVGALDAEDRGDLDVRVHGEERDPETGIVGSSDVITTTAVLRGAVAETISAGARPFLLGGCCTELPGALAGARDALGRVALAYLDGHLDLYDGVTSPTGEAADMPIAVALGHGPGAWVDVAGGASLELADVALVGHRDKDELASGMLELDWVGPALTHVPIEEVRADGASRIGERVAAGLSGRPFWVHLDVDVLDEEVFPATDYLMPGGMTWGELRETLAPLASAPELLGASVACYNPEKDPDRACGRALVSALGEAF
jgi:arginase